MGMVSHLRINIKPHLIFFSHRFGPVSISALTFTLFIEKGKTCDAMKTANYFN
jgi:hypothetical protein